LTITGEVLIVVITMKKHKENNKSKRRTVAITTSVVGALILFTAIGLLAYLPGKMSTTKYDFLYTLSYASGGKYSVDGGKLRIEPTSKYDYMEYGLDKSSAALYRYSVDDDTSNIVSDEDARAMTVSDKEQSPDGYSVVVKHNNTNYFPGPTGVGRSSMDIGYSIFLRKGISSRNINVTQIDYGTFQFVAWIIED
jgi:hypothetical protein